MRVLILAAVVIAAAAISRARAARFDEDAERERIKGAIRERMAASIESEGPGGTVLLYEQDSIGPLTTR